MLMLKNNIMRFSSFRISIKSSVKKIRSLLRLVKGLNVYDALLHLFLLNKNLLSSLVSLGISYSKDMLFNTSSLFIKEIKLSKSFTLMRSCIKAKGRLDKKKRRHAFITLILEKKINLHGSKS